MMQSVLSSVGLGNRTVHNENDYIKGHLSVGWHGGLRRNITPLGKRPPQKPAATAQPAEADAEAVADGKAAAVPRPPAAAVRGVPKDFANALIVMPPPELWGPIQDIRKNNDPAYARWMPHINMVWPFASEDHPRCAEALKAALCDVAPFELHFPAFDSFEKGTVFLSPADAAGAPHPALQQLRVKMLQTFPEFAPEGTAADAFHPHLTVGKMGSGQKAKFIRDHKWEPVSFVVKEVYIVSRPDKDTPFSVSQVVPLGGAR